MICLLLAPFFALPYAGENTIWAFNSQLYLLDITALATLAGLGFGKPGGGSWWLGLAAAVMGLFTMASGLLAPLAVAGLTLLRAIKQRRLEKWNFITLGACLAVVALGMALRVTMEDDRLLRAQSLMQFTSVLARNLTWPFFDVPEMVCLISLPLALLVALYFRPDFPAPRPAEFLLVFGTLGLAAIRRPRLWARELWRDRSRQPLHGRFEYFCHRQSVCHGAATAVVDPRPISGWAVTLLPLAFAGVIFFGLGRISQIVVDNLLRPTRMMNLVAEERVETFWATGESRDFFEPPTVRPSPEVALGVLRNVNLQTILPAVCLPPRFAARHRPVCRPGAVVAAEFSRRYCSPDCFCLRGLLQLTGWRAGPWVWRGQDPAGLIALLAGLAALGFVWSNRVRSGGNRVEYGLQRDLAAYF